MADTKDLKSFGSKSRVGSSPTSEIIYGTRNSPRLENLEVKMDKRIVVKPHEKMTKTAQKTPVKKPVSKEKEALEILKHIVNNVDLDTYNNLCDEGKNALMKAANLIGKTEMFHREIEFSFDNVLVNVSGHLDGDEYEAVIHIKNIRTQKIFETKADIYISWD